MMRFSKLFLFVLIAALVLVLSGRAQDLNKARADLAGTEKVGANKIALKAGRIITVIDDDIAPGVILIEDGKIKAVGDKDLEIPFDFWVIDASDKVVFPGMVEAHTSQGMSGYINRTNENLPVVPFTSVFDGIDPSVLYFEDALRDGVTTILISQGNNTVIGGMTRIVRPIGLTVDEMTVKADTGLKLSFTPMSGQDRLTQMALFRETFRELAEYKKNLAESKYEKDLEKKEETLKVPPEEAAKKGVELLEDADFDFKHLNLERLATGRLPAFVWCAEPMDVGNAVKIAKENGFLNRVIFVLGNECYKAVDEIKATGRPVVLESNMVYREEDPLTGEETEVFVPLAFYEAAIPFAITSNPYDSYGARYLWYQAARLVRNGIPRAEALKAITFTAASMIGVGNRLGAILPNYDATLLVLTGDPMSIGTWVDKVLIEGRVVYEREKDYRLKELLTGKKKAEEEEEKEKEQKAPGEEAPPEEEKKTDSDAKPGSDKKEAVKKGEKE